MRLQRLHTSSLQRPYDSFHDHHSNTTQPPIQPSHTPPPPKSPKPHPSEPIPLQPTPQRTRHLPLHHPPGFNNQFHIPLTTASRTLKEKDSAGESMPVSLLKHRWWGAYHIENAHTPSRNVIWTVANSTGQIVCLFKRERVRVSFVGRASCHFAKQAECILLLIKVHARMDIGLDVVKRQPPGKVLERLPMLVE